MKKSRKDVFNINPNLEEQEIESSLSNTWDSLPFPANTASNYISKVKIKNIDALIAIHEADNRKTNKAEDVSSKFSIFKEI